MTQESPEAIPFTAPPARAGARRRAALRLLVATGIAAAAGALVFVLVLEGEFLTAPAEGVMRFFYTHTTLAMLAACSPLFGAMLVGYGYMQRALRRRAARHST